MKENILMFLYLILVWIMAGVIAYHTPIGW